MYRGWQETQSQPSIVETSLLHSSSRVLANKKQKVRERLVATPIRYNRR